MVRIAFHESFMEVFMVWLLRQSELKNIYIFPVCTYSNLFFFYFDRIISIFFPNVNFFELQVSVGAIFDVLDNCTFS